MVGMHPLAFAVLLIYVAVAGVVGSVLWFASWGISRLTDLRRLRSWEAAGVAALLVVGFLGPGNFLNLFS